MASVIACGTPRFHPNSGRAGPDSTPRQFAKGNALNKDISLR
jgi:hypothetical protein